METENKTSRSLSDSQAVEVLLGQRETSEQEPKGQPEQQVKRGEAEPEKPQAISHKTEAPPVGSDEQVPDSVMDEEEDEPEQEQDALAEDESEPEEADDEHSEEADEEVAEEREIQPNDVIFHDPEGNPVTAEEAHKGYLRQSDYTKKTQEIAEQREAVKQAFAMRDQERQAVAEHINLAIGVLEPQLAELHNTDWDKLASEDPYQFSQKRNQYQRAQEKLHALQQAGQQTLQQANQERQQQLAKKLEAHSKLAQQLIPDLADPKKAPQVKARMKAYLTKAGGYSPEEVAQVSDARMLNLAYKALQFDLMNAQRNSAKDKKVKTAPRKGMKPGSPKTRAQRQEAEKMERMARLKRTGNVADAVDLILTPRS